MAAPTRFPRGVTNVAVTDLLGQYGLPDPTLWNTYFTDFNTYVAGDWTITSVGAATQALTDLDGGDLLLTNAAADDNSTFLQKKGESFTFETNKKLIFKARFKVSDATQSDLVMGLQITDTTPLAVSDGVWFGKDDGDAFIDFHMAKASAQTDATAIATITTAFVELGFYWDGNTTLSYWVNGVQIGSLTDVTNLPTTELTVSFGVQNGEAVAKNSTVDYIFAAKERG